ncbi:hypothetical protein [Nocardioides sp.]|uniref:hypothetical protein n=1 Tax=Nocardioides sp. TaxID=35761 RepID=UPI0025EC40A0|nr:hypothetical protein [Nocardioides sp.]
MAALTAFALAPLAAASAQTVTVSDGSSDTWQVSWDPNHAGSETYTQVGSVPNADVTTMTVSHTRKLIQVTVTYVDLVHDDAYQPEIREWFRLDDGTGAMLNLFVEDSWRKPEVFFVRRSVDGPWAARQRSRCAGVTSKLDVKRDTWTTTLPASCLGAPRWVQFHGATSSGGATNDDGTQTYVADNAHSEGIDDRITSASESCFTECEGWTGKIRRTR